MTQKHPIRKTKVFQMRLTAWEKQAWAQAARAQGRSLANWLRYLATQAIKNQKHRPV